MEPPHKLLKVEEFDIKEILLNMQSTFMNKLKSIEDKIEKLSSKYNLLEEKVEDILNKVKETTSNVSYSSFTGSNGETTVPNLLVANAEDTYPNGSWLGDPNNSNFRVRCSISPIDLETINSSCLTAEKMALTLLDYLFDRETQAVSNISGTGKHGKKQLDPVKIYGIKCHVMYMFGINNKDWLKIKQNLDSKCRTAFRRKLKGMPLTIKGCRERLQQSTMDASSLHTNESSSSDIGLSGDQQTIIAKPDSQTLQYVEQDIQQILPIKIEAAGCALTFSDAVGHAQIIHTEHGDIQVIQATEEQLEQLKQNHHIEILSHADVLSEHILDSTT